MKTRIHYLIALSCLSAVLALAQSAALEGTWVSDGVAVVEAAKKAGKSLNGLAEGTRIKFKVDVKKNKVSGTINQLNTGKDYDIQDGNLTDKTFTFKSLEVVSFNSNFGNDNFGNNQGGGGRGGVNATPPAPIPWKGELTDANTVTLTRLSATGEAVSTLVLHRAGK